MTELKNSIIKFVERNSYFMYSQDGRELLFCTRKHGSVSAEEVGREDVQEAVRLAGLIKEQFKSIETRIECVDEWVHLNVFKSKTFTNYKYVFKKNYNGAGFEEGFKTMNELIKKYGDWVAVDWEKIEEEVNHINEYPHNRFTEWYDSKPILIKKRGDENNRWGYNFYIYKSKMEETVYIDF